MKKISLIALFGAICACTEAHAVNFRQYAALKLTAPLSSKTEVKQKINMTDWSSMMQSQDDTTDDLDMETTNGLVIAYGVQLSDARVEIEYNHYFKDSTIEDTDLSIQNYALFANAYYDIKTNSPFTPYFGLGLGYNQQKVIADSESENLHSLAWKLAAGIGWKVSNMVTLDIGYRYINFGGTEYTENGIEYPIEYSYKAEFNNIAHELTLGARVSF